MLFLQPFAVYHLPQVWYVSPQQSARHSGNKQHGICQHGTLYGQSEGDYGNI